MSRGVQFSAHRLIRAPVQRVWHLLSRPEIHPRYATMWMAADVLERSPTGAVVELRGFFGGLPITSVQRLIFKPPGRLEFRQIRGELRDLSGAYTLRDAEGETDLTCEMTVDAGIALFSDAAVEQILAGHTEGTLTRMKVTAERDLVRPVLRRRGAAPEATVNETKDTEEGVDDEPSGSESRSEGEEEEAAETAPSAGQPAPAAVLPHAAGSPGDPSAPRRRRRRRGRRRRGGPSSGPGAGQTHSTP